MLQMLEMGLVAPSVPELAFADLACQRSNGNCNMSLCLLGASVWCCRHMAKQPPSSRVLLTLHPHTSSQHCQQLKMWLSLSSKQLSPL